MIRPHAPTVAKLKWCSAIHPWFHEQSVHGLSKNLEVQASSNANPHTRLVKEPPMGDDLIQGLMLARSKNKMKGKNSLTISLNITTQKRELSRT